jgi:hypothetical protein
MSKNIPLSYAGAFALSLAVSTPALAQYDTDPLVNGLPCNSLCRAWLAIPSISGEPVNTNPPIDTGVKDVKKTDPRGPRTQTGSDKKGASPTKRAAAPATTTARSSAADQRLKPRAPKARRDDSRQAPVASSPSQDAHHNHLVLRYNHLISLQKASARAGRNVRSADLVEPDTTKVIPVDANQPASSASAPGAPNGNLSSEAEQSSPNLARKSQPSDLGPSEIEQQDAPRSPRDGDLAQQLAGIPGPAADATAVPSTDNLSAILATRREISNLGELANLTVAIDGKIASVEGAIREAFFAVSGAPINISASDAEALKRLIEGEVDAAVIGLVSSAAAEASLDGYSVFLLNLHSR